MNVAEVMTREVGTCTAEHSLAHVAKLMREYECGWVPVVDEHGFPVGVVTDRDICMAAYARGLPLQSIRVTEAATRRPVVVHEHDSLELAETLMRTSRVRRLPVTDIYGRLTGVLSLHDLAVRATQLGASKPTSLTAARIAHLLSAVSQPARRTST